MATNKRGGGTVNFSVNISLEERAALGKIAFALGDSSVGDLVKRAVLDYLDRLHPEHAKEIHAIREAQRAKRLKQPSASSFAKAGEQIGSALEAAAGASPAPVPPTETHLENKSPARGKTPRKRRDPNGSTEKR